jgi:hypothetical protein
MSASLALNTERRRAGFSGGADEFDLGEGQDTQTNPSCACCELGQASLPEIATGLLAIMSATPVEVCRARRASVRGKNGPMSTH